MKKISRRSLLKGMGSALPAEFLLTVSFLIVQPVKRRLCPACTCLSYRLPVRHGCHPRWGFAGLYCATTLRNIAPDVEVIVVEKTPFFVSGPSHIDFVAGLKHLDDISRSYDPISARGIKIVRSEVIQVAADKNMS